MMTSQHSTIEVLFLRVFLVGPLASDVLANVFGTPFNHGMPKFLFASPVWSCKKNTKRDSQNRTTKKLSPITISNRMHVARKPPTPAALLVFSLPPPFSLSSHKLAVWVNLASKVPILLFPAQTIIRPADRPNPWFFDFSPVPSNHTQGFHHWRSWPKLDTPQQQHNPH